MKMYLFIQLFMIGAMLQGLFGAHNTNRTIHAQAEENQKNREYNLQLAKMQNEWNLQQWERENEYNNPLNQMQRLKAAGLNPNLVYGNGAGQSTAAPSPQLTSGSPSMPQDMSLMASRPTIGTIMAQGLQNEMMRAQIDKVKAETRSEGYQADILASDAAFRDAINQGNIDLGNMQIKGIDSSIKLNSGELEKLRKEMSKLDAETKNLILEYDKIKSSIANLDADTAIKRLRDSMDDPLVQKELEKLSSSISVDMATAKRITTLLSAELLGLEAGAEFTWSQVDNERLKGLEISANTESIQYSLSQAKTFNDAERATGIYGKIMTGLTPIAALVGLALNGKKPITVKGFR